MLESLFACKFIYSLSSSFNLIYISGIVFRQVNWQTASAPTEIWTLFIFIDEWKTFGKLFKFSPTNARRCSHTSNFHGLFVIRCLLLFYFIYLFFLSCFTRDSQQTHTHTAICAYRSERVQKFYASCNEEVSAVYFCLSNKVKQRRRWRQQQ